MSGVVENGATIRTSAESQVSSGSDDIFVAQLSTVDGNIRWLKQVGSDGSDSLARGGGIVADSDGNAVVFGDTDGSFYRSRSSEASAFRELFVLVMDKADGSHQAPASSESDTEPDESSVPKDEVQITGFDTMIEWVKERWWIIPLAALGILLLCGVSIYGAVCNRRRSGGSRSGTGGRRRRRVGPSISKDPEAQRKETNDGTALSQELISSSVTDDDDASVSSDPPATTFSRQL